MAAPIDRSMFESMYATGARWDVGRPQQAFINVASQIQGSVLDAGCGTGDLAIFLAMRGNLVTGIDFLEEPIRRAKLKANERGLAISFLVMDATRLAEWNDRFDNVVDSGLFHVFTDDDRKKYVAGLATVLKSGGRLFLICFSNEEPGSDGPRRVAEQELYESFSGNWEIESIERARFEIRTDLKDREFSAGGPKTWFAIIRRR